MPCKINLNHTNLLQKGLKELSNINLEDNPICDQDDYKKTMFEMFPQLEVLDGVDKEGAEVLSEEDEEDDYGDEYGEEVDGEGDYDEDNIDPELRRKIREQYPNGAGEDDYDDEYGDEEGEGDYGEEEEEDDEENGNLGKRGREDSDEAHKVH